MPSPTTSTTPKSPPKSRLKFQCSSDQGSLAPTPLLRRQRLTVGTTLRDSDLPHTASREKATGRQPDSDCSVHEPRRGHTKRPRQPDEPHVADIGGSALDLRHRDPADAGRLSQICLGPAALLAGFGDALTEADKIIDTGRINARIEGGLTCHVSTCIPVTTTPTYGSELTKPLVRLLLEFVEKCGSVPRTAPLCARGDLNPHVLADTGT